MFSSGHRLLLVAALLSCGGHHYLVHVEADSGPQSYDPNNLQPLNDQLNSNLTSNYYQDVDSNWTTVMTSTSRGRFRRQMSFVQCPSEPARSRSGKTRAIVAYYSEDSRRDVNIVQRKGDWQSSDIEVLLREGFDVNKPSLLYTHGYLQTIKSPWLMEIRQRFNEIAEKTNSGQYNLMFFDWSSYYAGRSYSETASYVPYLGKILSQYLEQLASQTGYNMTRFHIISYSLSTHISGQTGRKMSARNKLGQITALDPTGVCFQSDAVFASKYSLRPDDAQLVVAKHYDMGRLGSRKLVGRVDVLVNGGSDQPAMVPRRPSILQVMGSAGGLVSHTRASEHEAERFDATCHEMAYECRSYKSFLAGECGDCGPKNNKCWFMNTLAPFELQQQQQLQQQQLQIDYKPNTKMYLTTGRLSFCVHQYQVVAKLANASKTKENVKKAIESGGLVLRLEGDSDGRRRSPMEAEIVPKNRIGRAHFTALLSLDSRIARFEDEMLVTSNYSDKTLAEMLAALKYVDIKYMSNYLASERLRASARYCPNASTGKTLVKCS